MRTGAARYVDAAVSSCGCEHLVIWRAFPLQGLSVSPARVAAQIVTSAGCWGAPAGTGSRD